MTAETNALHCYESIAEASARMLAAARRADWDALIAAEKECAQRVERLKAARAGGTFGHDGDARRHDIIRTVLAHDAEIRALTQPWMANLEQLLHSVSAGHRVEQAYR